MADDPPSPADLVALIQAHQPELQADGVETIILFGSVRVAMQLMGLMWIWLSGPTLAFRMVASTISAVSMRFENGWRPCLDEPSTWWRNGRHVRVCGRRSAETACVPSKRPAARLQDILDNARLIQSYLRGMDDATFHADSRTRDAVERCLMRLSEAATKLGSQAEELAPGPPWQAVRSFGNVLRHAYDQVEPERILEIASRDLPQVIAAVESALRRLAG